MVVVGVVAAGDVFVGVDVVHGISVVCVAFVVAVVGEGTVCVVDVGAPPLPLLPVPLVPSVFVVGAVEVAVVSCVVVLGVPAVAEGRVSVVE